MFRCCGPAPCHQSGQAEVKRVVVLSLKPNHHHSDAVINVGSGSVPPAGRVLRGQTPLLPRGNPVRPCSRQVCLRLSGGGAADGETAGQAEGRVAR